MKRTFRYNLVQLPCNEWGHQLDQVAQSLSNLTLKSTSVSSNVLSLWEQHREQDLEGICHSPSLKQLDTSGQPPPVDWGSCPFLGATEILRGSKECTFAVVCSVHLQGSSRSSEAMTGRSVLLRCILGRLEMKLSLPRPCWIRFLHFSNYNNKAPL